MGSFDVRCCISGIKMRHGTPIVLVPIIKSNDIGTCHTNSFYVPIMLPVHGKYNDYGGIEELEQTDKNIQAHNANKRAVSSFFDMLDDYDKTDDYNYRGLEEYVLTGIDSFSKYEPNNQEHFKLPHINVAIFNKTIWEYANKNSEERCDIIKRIGEEKIEYLEQCDKNDENELKYINMHFNSLSFLSEILQRINLRKYERTTLFTKLIRSNIKNDQVISSINDLANVLRFMDDTGKYLLPLNILGEQYWSKSDYEKEMKLNLLANEIMNNNIAEFDY